MTEISVRACAVFAAMGRLFERAWYAVRWLLDPVFRPITAPAARLVERATEPMQRRHDLEDLGLANQLQAAGLADNADRLRSAVGQRKAYRS